MANPLNIQLIPIKYLKPGPFQTREHFAANELAKSMVKYGLIQPIVVRRNFNTVRAGERRWRTSQITQLHEVPCIVKRITDVEAMALSALENLQRKNLNPIEIARTSQKIIDETHCMQADVATIVSKSREAVAHTLRVLKLAQPIKALLIEGKISERHKKILAVLDKRLQIQLSQLGVKSGWNVRQLENEVRKINKKLNNSPETVDPNIKRLEKTLSDQLGTEVKLEDDERKSSGWLKIKYFSPDTLTGILAKLGIQDETK